MQTEFGGVNFQHISRNLPRSPSTFRAQKFMSYPRSQQYSRYARIVASPGRHRNSDRNVAPPVSSTKRGRLHGVARHTKYELANTGTYCRYPTWKLPYAKSNPTQCSMRSTKTANQVHANCCTSKPKELTISFYCTVGKPETKIENTNNRLSPPARHESTVLYR